jgi:tripartite-type tricarboxylate transporter receptor subunit TctC
MGKPNLMSCNAPGEALAEEETMKFGSGLAAAVLAGALSISGACAQGYPSRSITLVVPFAAGGPSDSIARLVGRSMSETLGQQIVVENTAGAGGTAGANRVAKAASDGHTLLIHHVALAAGAALYNNPGYDTLSAFEPVGLVNFGPFVLISKKGFSANTLSEFLDQVKRNAGAISVAHAGVGSGSHLCGIMLGQALGVTLNFVPYRGTAPALNDVVGGQVDLLCDQTTNAVPQIAAGTVKAFAVTSTQPIAQLPGLPTVGSAIPGFDLTVWHAIYGPKGMPKDAVDKLNAALQKALGDVEINKRFAELGTLLFPAAQRAPAALQAKLESEVKHWSAVVKAAGVQPQ